MLSPLSIDELITSRQDDLLREAAAERLARQVSRRPTRWRSRMAEALYGLAVRLDPCALRDGLPSGGGDRLNGVYRTGGA